jgi:hypothetical protein
VQLVLASAARPLSTSTSTAEASAVFLTQPGWQRVAVAAILVIPLIVLVLLSMPAWITWPFLGTERRGTVLEFVDRLVELTTALTKSG